MMQNGFSRRRFQPVVFSRLGSASRRWLVAFNQLVSPGQGRPVVRTLAWSASHSAGDAFGRSVSAGWFGPLGFGRGVGFGWQYTKT